jgi:hypothetical protein
LIRITDAFLTSGYSTPGTPFTIACDSFKNPRTTAVTSSFKIYTFDGSGNAMEYGITGITTQMKSTPDLK